MSTPITSRHRQPKKILAAIAGLAIVFTGLSGTQALNQASAADPLPYQNTALSFSVRAADLVSRMTQTEKIQQFRAERQYQSAIAPAIARLGVGAYNYWNEAMHGIAHAGRTNANAATFNKGGEATEFPSPIAMAASWDPELIKAAGTIVSDEGRAMTNYENDPAREGYAPHKGLTYWTPTVNLARDPRWGRTEETWGEDPYLTGEMAGGYVDGLQGNDPKYLKTAATPKHYFANNSENDRRWASEQVTEREIREYYTPQFATLASEHNARSLMTAYNAVNGTPMSASFYSLETLARRTWGFDGAVVSDCGAIGDVYDANKHAFTPPGSTAPANNALAVAWTLKAGTDLACSGGEYAGNAGFPTSLNNGYITNADMDIALTRAFTLRMEFGEFDPTTPWSSYDIDVVAPEKPEHQAAALSTSEQSVVLLKNAQRQSSQAKALPLTAADASNIIILGPQAEISVHGNYSPTRRIFEQTPLDALTKAAKAANPSANVRFYPGISGDPKIGGARGDWARTKPTIGGTVNPGGNAAVRFLDASDAELGRVTVPEIVQQRDFLGWTASSKNVTTLTTNASWLGHLGFTTDVPAGTTQIELRQSFNAANHYPADKSSFTLRKDSPQGAALGTMPGQGQSSANTYQRMAYTGPTGNQHLYLTYDTTFYETTLNQDIDSDNPGNTWADAIRTADAVIVYVGTLCSNNQTQPTLSNNPADGREDEDRASYNLARAQDQLAAEVAALNPHTIVYMATTNAVDVTSFENKASALLWTAYNGQAQSEAAARVLFGQANPTAKLPMTWYKNLNDFPNLFDYGLAPVNGKSGRTYQYYNGDVTYPFGHGLSYSSYEYSDLQLSTQNLNINGTLTASVKVKNTSTLPGKEIVELFASSPKATNPLYPKAQLKGFQKVALAAGETKTVSIDLKGSDLWFWDDVNMKQDYALGTWKLLVGPSSDAARGLTSNFTLSGTLTPAVKTVTAIADGVVLNLARPDNVIHSKLSASRNDQSFYDLNQVEVSYTSSNPAVATVSPAGVVTPTGVGTAEITATVRADGTQGSDSFPVVVYYGALTSEYNSATTTLYATDVSFPDGWADSTQAVDPVGGTAAGVALSAEVPGSASGEYTYTYSIAAAEENAAEARIDADGKLRAKKEGNVRVTVVARQVAAPNTVYGHTATIRVGDAPINTSALQQRITQLENLIAADMLIEDEYTADSWTELQDAIAAGKAALTATEQLVVDNALAAINTKVAALVNRGDIEALSVAMSIYQGLAAAAGIYTSDSWSALAAAAATAQGYVTDPVNVTQPQVDAALDAINAAIAGLQIAVVKTSLSALISNVEQQMFSGLIVQTNFSEVSWNNLQTALASARATNNSSTATQAQVDSAVTALQNAVASLETRRNTDQLKSLVDSVTAMGLVASDYTTASWATYQGALSAARAQVAAPTTQAAVNAAATALSNAISGLQLDPNRTSPAALTALVTATEQRNPASYTATSWARVTSALAQAKQALAGGTNADAAQAQATLLTALDQLAARPTTAGLASIVAAAQAINTASYTAASTSGLLTALATAQNLLAQDVDSLTQSQIDAASTALSNAISGLQLDPNRTSPAALTALVTATEQRNPASYTATSWARVTSALAQAKQALAGGTNADAAQAQATLLTALDQLAARPTTAGLASVVAAAQAINTASYTAASTSSLLTALATAQNLLAQDVDLLSQSEINAATTAISTAIGSLVVAPVVTPPTEQPTTKPPVTAPEKVTTKSVTVKGAAFKKNTAPKISVTVKLSAGTAKGKVDVYVGSKLVKTVSVSTLTTSITLPSKYKKAITVKAQYKPAKVNVNGTQKLSAAVTIKTK